MAIALNHTRKKPFWVKGLLFLALWTFIGLSFASQFYISSSQFGLGVTWRQAVTWSLGDWYVWAALSIPVIALARLFRLERSGGLANIGAHLVFSACVSLVYVVLRAWVGQWQSWLEGEAVAYGEVFQPVLVKTFHFNLLIYWAIVSVVHAVDFYRKYQEHAVQAAELERSLVQARLQALQAQLNPHFLFNTLHAIACLMHKDVDLADRMIVRLSDLLRHTLAQGAAQEVPLEQELLFLEDYLEIEQTRFGERLEVVRQIDPQALPGRVPCLMLQPLLENAIRHGIEPHARPGRIELRARRDEQWLRLEVSDNGDGIGAGNGLEEGIGLSNTRARLQQLYPGRHQFRLVNQPGGGLRVELSLPFQTETPARSGTPASLEPAFEK